MNEKAFFSYAAKTPEARKQERDAMLCMFLRDYQNAVNESAPDAVQELLWCQYCNIEALYNSYDARLA